MAARCELRATNNMSHHSTEQMIEAALFFKGGTLSIKALATALKTSDDDIEKGIVALRTALEGRGIRLVREGSMVALATAPDAKDLIEEMRHDELEGPLGKAGLETLAVVIFRGPLSKSDIDYIRGVNC